MQMKSWTKCIAVTALLLLVASCGSGESEKTAQTPAERAAALDIGPRAAETLKFDASLAENGALLFDEKSCSDCHTLGEADIAPDPDFPNATRLLAASVSSGRFPGRMVI